MGGDPPRLIRELQLLAQLGASEGSMLWALLRRAHLLAAIRAEFDRAGNLDAAMTAVGKAVFWKDKPALQDWIARIKACPAYQNAIPETKQRLPKPDWNQGVWRLARRNGMRSDCSTTRIE